MFYRIAENDDDAFPKFSRHTITIEEVIAQGLDVNLEDIRSLFDEETFQRLYCCQYFDDESSFFTFDEIKAIVSDSCLKSDTDALLYGGLDIGRKNDTTDIVLVEPVTDRQSASDLVIMRRWDQLRRKPYEEQKNHCRNLLKTLRIKDFNADATGPGE